MIFFYVKIKDSIGKGEFGEVLLADYKGEKIAVKQLKDLRTHTHSSLIEEAYHMT